MGLKLRFQTDGRGVQGRWVPRVEHVGFKQTLHGGVISTLLDEMMAWACAVQARRFAYCAELTVRFLRTIRPGDEVLARGELVANRRGKLFEAKAELRDPAGSVLATATGKYLPVKQEDLKDMATDLIGDPKWFLGTDEA